jgi:hypothetical protein
MPIDQLHLEEFVRIVMPKIHRTGADLTVSAKEHHHRHELVAGKYWQGNGARQSDRFRSISPLEI